VSPFELFAVLFGIISVYLSVRQNIWSWPTAIVNVTLYIIVFYQARLYADMGLQVIYIVISLYGWYAWLYGGANRTELPVSRASRRAATVLPVIGLASTALLGTVLHRTTDAALPYLDSTTTSTSLIAQWMMTRKILENWLVWIAVDVVYIGMFLYKALYLTAGLYVVFLVLSTMGYRDWRRAYSRRGEDQDRVLTPASTS
jgi:nicotinamide mononucleotide transporter